MGGPFHAGELELQRRAGTLEDAAAVGRILRSVIPPGAARFLARQPFAVASSVDGQGRVWASLLVGRPCSIQRVDDRMLRLAARPLPEDPLAANLAARPELGLLVLDPRTRQRLRFNGRGLLEADGVFLLADQAYGNCPKYIQLRSLETGPAAAAPGEPRLGKRLSPGQQDWIRRADTLFIASFHPRGGADASHRGGLPGFVRVPGPGRVAFDDYPGNGMFNTLGNLVAHLQASLLFVDFEAGHVLQLAGRARVGADFAVTFDVESVRETPDATPLRFRFLEYSPAIPRPSHPPGDGISKVSPADAGSGGTE